MLAGLGFCPADSQDEGSERVPCTVIKVKRHPAGKWVMDVKLDRGGLEIDVLEDCLERQSASSIELTWLRWGDGNEGGDDGQSGKRLLASAYMSNPLEQPSV
jgi:hypothetical protein